MKQLVKMIELIDLNRGCFNRLIIIFLRTLFEVSICTSVILDGHLITLLDCRSLLIFVSLNNEKNAILEVDEDLHARSP